MSESIQVEITKIQERTYIMSPAYAAMYRIEGQENI